MSVPNAPCKRCEAGPANIEGHDDLFMQSFVGKDVMMKCRVCGSLWTRKSADGHYTWARAQVFSGSLLP